MKRIWRCRSSCIIACADNSTRVWTKCRTRTENGGIGDDLTMVNSAIKKGRFFGGMPRQSTPFSFAPVAVLRQDRGLSRPKQCDTGKSKAPVQGTRKHMGFALLCIVFSGNPRIFRQSNVLRNLKRENSASSKTKPPRARNESATVAASAPLSMTERIRRRKCVSGKISPRYCAQTGIPR